MFKSKRISLLTILALLIPTSAGFAGVGISAANAATDLAVFTVNGEDVSSVSTLTLEPYATSVAVVATPSEAGATTAITLNGTPDGTVVTEGNNTLSVTVTDSASVTETKTVTLVVPKGDNTDSVIVVNQEELINGEGTEVDWGITSVPVSVTLTDAAATVTVNGVALAKSGAVATGSVTGLTTGENPVSVVVTAADGFATEETQLAVTVLLNTDTAATFTVDGTPVLDGGSVTIAKGATEADVSVYTRDENATVEIVGGIELNSGENQVEIYVTAEDRTTVDRYDITLIVPANDDATLADLTVNGLSYSDNEDVLLPYQTTSVNVGIFLNDIDASYVIEGGSDLVQGPNALIITVTAFDNVTTETYTLNLEVGDPDVTLSGITFNGAAVAVDGTVETYSLTNFMTVSTTDPRATVTVSVPFNTTTGALTLEPGDNDVTITVLGDDKKTTADYTFTVQKAGFEVDFGGETTVVVVNGSAIEVPANTHEVTVEVTAPVDGSVVEIEGDKDLVRGANQVYVTITYPNLRVVTTQFQVTVLPISTEATITVGDEEVTLVGTAGTLTLEAGTTDVDVVVEAIDEDATFVITGGTNLVLGNNTLTVVLTTSDGQEVTYIVTLIVPASTNADFDAITINGVAFADEELIEVNSGVVDVQVDLEERNATVAITGVVTPNTIGGNVAINNGVITASGYVTLTVVVTAQDGLAKSAPVEINLLASTDLGVANGSNPSDDEIRVGTYAKVDGTLVRNQFAAGDVLAYKWTVDGIADATARTSRFLLVADNLEEEVRPVVTTGTGAALKTIVGKTFVVAKGIIKKAPTPAVLGKAAIGLELKAITKVWSTDVDLAYKWYVNYDSEPGAENEAVATTPEFLLAGDLEIGSTITLGVTGSLEGYEDIEKLSAPLTVTIGSIKITEKPSFEADSAFVTGGTITANPGKSNVEDAEAAFEWTRNGVVIAGATDEAYELTGADFNKKVAVKVTYSAEGYTSASITLKSPTIKVATLEEVSAPTITAAGRVLTAVDGFSTDVTATSVQYVWYRNGRVITDAKSSTYTLKAKDVKGTKITVRVIGSYLGYKSTSVISDPEEPFVVPAN